MSAPIRVPSLALAAALVLASCSGSTANAPLPATVPTSDTNAPVASHAPKHRVKATIRITIPKRKHRQHRRRQLVALSEASRSDAQSKGERQHYVSAATQSIAIAVTPQGSGTTTNDNADLTPASNPGCTVSTISSTICTVSLDLAPGGYTASFATYDGLLDGGNAPNNPPTGNELSANQEVSFTVKAGSSNTIAVTLGGIPASLAIVPSNDATMHGSTAGGFTISKCLSTEHVEVLGIDADGNYIVGAGAPTPSLTSDTPAYLAVATPAPNAPNTFALSGTFASGTPAPTAIPTPGAVVHLAATVTPASDSGGSPVTASSVPVTFDDSICGIVTEFPVISASAAPYDITAGIGDGNLWFTENAVNQVGAITATSGTVTEYSSGLDADDGLRGIAATWTNSNFGLSRNQHVTFAEYERGGFGYTTTGGPGTASGQRTGDSGEISKLNLPADAALNGIVANSYTVVYATDPGANAIDMYLGTTLSPQGASWSIPTANSSPQRIAVGPDDNLWFTECAGNKIGQLNPGTGVISEFSTGISADAGPYGIATGADGNLWFTESTGNRIGRITPSGTVTEFSTGLSAGAQPWEIAAGPDGNLYFTEKAGNRIGRVTTSGVITEFSAGISPGAMPFGITVGPDNNIWFTEIDGNNIARMQ